MQIPLSLLKNYIDLSDLDVKKISEILTDLGIEVDNIINETPSFSNVIAALVEEVSPHPNADKLKIATVFDGKGKYQVVCGAPNCRKGIKVAFAPIGSFLKTENGDSFQIKKCKLRNIESFGMLCSQKELQLGNDHDGIWELPEEIEIGTDLSTEVDPIFEISLTPNLGHCMYAIGIAREIAAKTGKKLKKINDTYKTLKSLKTEDKIKINIQDKKGCLRYSALYIENVEVKESPQWLQKYLLNSNIRPINNIVDILNFVMLEMGQPMHAFDISKLPKETIDVYSLSSCKNCVTLEKENKKIDKDTLVIGNDDEIIAIAGVIGSFDSSVDNATRNILIESAYFDPIYIRKAMKALNLRTESAQRFEKNIDPNGTIKALNRVAALIEEASPNCKIASTIIDEKEKEFEKRKIKLKEERVNKILGTKLSQNEISNILNSLEITTHLQKENTLECTIPTYRNDIKLDIDLIEEIARIYGYNNIERKAPKYSSSSITDSPLYLFEKELKAHLISFGLKELITADLISPKMAAILEEKDLPKNALIKTLHFKSEDQSILRPSFMPSFLEVLKFNSHRNNFDLHFFEVGKIHYKDKENIIEKPTFAITLYGNENRIFWKEKQQKVNFYTLKGIVEDLFSLLGIKNYALSPSAHGCLHPNQQANIYLEDILIGTIGNLHPKLKNKYDLKENCFFAELSSYELMKFQIKEKKYTKISQYPSSQRDWTINLKKENINMPYILKNISSSLLEKAFIIDVFVPEKTKDEKNVTIRFIYRDPNKTISYEEVEKEHEKIKKNLEKELLN